MAGIKLSQTAIQSLTVLPTGPYTPNAAIGSIESLVFDRGGQVFNVKSTKWGAKGDAQTVSDGAMNGTTGVLTSASNKFVAGDVGKSILIVGAGTAGANLVTTIASYQSAGQVTTTAVSATNVSGALVWWATDDTTAIQAAITAAGANAIIFFPPGTYLFSSNITAASGQAYVGSGMSASTILTFVNSWPGGTRRAPIEFGTSTISNCSVRDLGFNIISPNCAVLIGSATNTRIERCLFTGTTNGNSMIEVDQGWGAPLGTQILNNRFVNCINVPAGAIELYSHSGSVDLIDTLIQGNHFESVFQYAIQFTVVSGGGVIRRTKIALNECLQMIGPTGGGGSYATFITAGLGWPYLVEDLEIIDNQYRNSNTWRQIFCAIYSCKNVKIRGNSAVLTSAYADTIAIAPGRTTNPIIGCKISENWFEGWGSLWDPDSMTFTEVCDNVWYNSGTNSAAACAVVGYSIQKFNDFHDNIIYNSITSSFPGAMVIDGISPAAIACKVHHNIFIDDAGSPNIVYLVQTTGAGVFDSSAVEITDNLLYLPNGNLTATINKQNAANVVPRVIERNRIYQLNGTYEDIASQAVAVGGAGTVTPDTLMGSEVYITYSGSFTLAAPLPNPENGRRLRIKFIHDNSASAWVITWNAVYKRAGAAFANTNTANAVDSIEFRADGTNWIEVARSINIS